MLDESSHVIVLFQLLLILVSKAIVLLDCWRGISTCSCCNIWPEIHISRKTCRTVSSCWCSSAWSSFLWRLL